MHSEILSLGVKNILDITMVCAALSHNPIKQNTIPYLCHKGEFKFNLNFPLVCVGEGTDDEKWFQKHLLSQRMFYLEYSDISIIFSNS